MAEGRITMMGLRGHQPTAVPPASNDIPSKPDVQPAPKPQPTVQPKAPTKKHDEVSIAIRVDGIEIFLRYSVPLSASLMSGQKSREYMGVAFSEMLSARFGQVTQL